MIQTAKPIADVFNGASFPNQWLTHLNGLTNLFAEIDEAYNDFNDFIKVFTSVTLNTICVMKLTNLQTPPNRTNHVMHIWVQELLAGNGTTALIVELREGYVNEGARGTLIAQGVAGNPYLPELLTGFNFSVSVGQASLISDYNNLFVRFELSVAVVPGNDGCKVTQFYFTTPAPGLIGSNLTVVPVSPIAGEAQHTGTINGGPLVQLFNPPGSAKKIVIYQLKVFGANNPSSNTGFDRQSAHGIRRTDNPFDMGPGDSWVDASSARVNPLDLTPILGKLRSVGFVNFQYHNPIQVAEFEFDDFEDIDVDGQKLIGSQWLGFPDSRIIPPLITPVFIRTENSFPWAVMPGSALEVLVLDNGLGRVAHASFLWDELPI